VRTRASESTVFGLKNTKKSTKVVKKRWRICSGRRSRKFESCHLDQNQKRKARPSFFDFQLKFIDLNFAKVRTAYLLLLCAKPNIDF